MSKKILFLSAASALILGYSANVQADDSVMVDLSVLNSLPASSPAYTDNQPLFPVVKKAVSKPRPAPQKTIEQKPEELKPAPVKEVIKVEAKPDIIIEPVDVKLEGDVDSKQVEKDMEEFAKEKTPEVVADEEIKTEAEAQPAAESSDSEEPASPAEDASAVEPPFVSTETSEDAKRLEEASEVEPIAEPVVEAENEPTAELVAEPVAKLLIPSDSSLDVVSEAPDADVANRIYFVEDSTELGDDDKAKIDAIIASFEDAKNNKIGIIAYNFDDNGEETFKKKRQSLNRAIEIRSHLLAKGYKNFSIKVINISDDPSKKNTVEIEEIK